MDRVPDERETHRESAVSHADAGDLIRVAGRIEAHAQALRTQALGLAAAGVVARWHSPAAVSARRHMEHSNAQLTAAATRLEHAAAMLRSHAHTVRCADSVGVVAQRLDGEVAHVAGEIGHASGSAAHAAEATIGTVRRFL